MPSNLTTASQQAFQPRVVGFNQLRATLDVLAGWVSSSSQPTFVGAAVEQMVVTPSLATWRLSVAFNQNVSRILFTPRHPLVDPPEYIDAMTSGGTAFYLQRVNGVYAINGTSKLTQASFNNAIARAIAR